MAGCNSDEISLATNAKANQPVPPKLIQAMVEKDMDLNSPVLVRLFKQEAELEVWKQDRSGRFALLKTYPICRWSGDLGPKVREGDRQAPEGFYNISPAQMNPQSAYYLSFNTGYPNAFDKALGRTGSQLMVHGDCSSRGCYAMTDEQIAEIYSLGRESFFGGQKSFQLQAYPFKMTPINMAKHRNNPNMPFWKMIKEGYDHFEVTKQEPRVDFCEKKYVFDAIKAPNATRDPVFDASAKCPAYAIPEEVADAVREKQATDIAETAKLIARGTPVARINTGIDGGMNKVFAARVPEGNTGLSEGGDSQGLAMLALSRAPGTIPSTVNPPRAGDAVRQPVAGRAGRAAASGSTRADGRPDAGRQCGAHRAERRLLLQSRPQGRHRRQRGCNRHRKHDPAGTPKPKVIEAKRTDAPPRPEAAMPKPAAAPKAVATAKPALKPSVSDAPAAAAPAPAAPRPGGRLSADRVVELVRQPLRRREISPTALCFQQRNNCRHAPRNRGIQYSGKFPIIATALRTGSSAFADDDISA